MRGESPEAVSTLLLQDEGLRGLQVRPRAGGGRAAATAARPANASVASRFGATLCLFSNF
jgi:hypothetical protein